MIHFANITMSQVFSLAFKLLWAYLMAQRLKHLPAIRETGVRSLGWEDPLEKEMVTDSSILAWRIPWKEKPGRLQSHGVAKSWTRLSDFTSLHFTSSLEEKL